jgi:polygalacturonase
MKIKHLSPFATSITAMISVFLLELPSSALTVNITPTSSIQQACDQVNAAGGGTVNLSSGVYTIYSTVELHSNITVSGVGAGQTIIKGPASGYSWPIVEVTGDNIHNVTIQRLTIDGNIAQGWWNNLNNPYKTQCGIHLFCPTANASGAFNINNVEVHNCTEGIGGGNINGVTIYNCAVHDNGVIVASGLYQHNLYFNSCSNVLLNQSGFYNSWGGCGIHLSAPYGYGDHWTIINCGNITSNSEDGMLIQDSANYVTVQNNTVKNNGFGSQWASNVLAQDGIDLSGGANVLITGNHSDNNKGHGLRTLAGTGSATGNEASGNAAGNYLFSTGITQSGKRESQPLREGRALP